MLPQVKPEPGGFQAHGEDSIMAELGKFTLILNQIKGTRRTVDTAPAGTTVDLVRLKTKFPSIFNSITATGVKVTLTAKVDEEGKPYVAQHPNEAVQYQCLTGVKEVQHTMMDRGSMNKKGPATLRKLDLSYTGKDGKPGARCTNLVIVAKGDENHHAPVCEECSGASTKGKSSANLPQDILGALGLDTDEV